MSGSSYSALQIPLKGVLVFECKPWVPDNSDYDDKMTCDFDDVTDKQQTVLPYKKRCAPRHASRMLKTNGKHDSVTVQIGKPRIKKAKTEGPLIKFMNNDDWRRKHEIDRNGWLKLSKSKWFQDEDEIKTNGMLKFCQISGSDGAEETDWWVEHKIKFDGIIKYSTAEFKKNDLAQSKSSADERMFSAVEKLEKLSTLQWWVFEEPKETPS